MVSALFEIEWLYVIAGVQSLYKMMGRKIWHFSRLHVISSWSGPWDEKKYYARYAISDVLLIEIVCFLVKVCEFQAYMNIFKAEES